MYMSNNTNKRIDASPNDLIGILDVRSLGYFHIGFDHLKQDHLKGYKFKSLHEVEYQMNKMIDFVNDQNNPPRKRKGQDPYPWLDPMDPRRTLTDDEILDKTINLEDSCLNSKEKRHIMCLIKHYKKAFSLRDEIGKCPNICLNIDVIDDSPFFVRPFPIAERDKPIMDKQMNQLVNLGILSPNNTSHTSPVMLITHKVTQDKRPVVDFRLLNTHIR